MRAMTGLDSELCDNDYLRLGVSEYASPLGVYPEFGLDTYQDCPFPLLDPVYKPMAG